MTSQTDETFVPYIAVEEGEEYLYYAPGCAYAVDNWLSHESLYLPDGQVVEAVVRFVHIDEEAVRVDCWCLPGTTIPDVFRSMTLADLEPVHQPMMRSRLYNLWRGRQVYRVDDCRPGHDMGYFLLLDGDESQVYVLLEQSETNPAPRVSAEDVIALVEMPDAVLVDYSGGPVLEQYLEWKRQGKVVVWDISKRQGMLDSNS